MATQQSIWGEQIVAPTNMTGDDLLRLPEDGTKNELYEGVVIRETMTSPLHGKICNSVGAYLLLHMQAQGLPYEVLQNSLFDLTPTGANRRIVLAPDVAVLRQGAQVGFTVTTDVPLIAVEVVSPSQTLAELALKAQIYRSAGVDEVWLIDPNTRVAEQWTAGGMTTLSATGTLTTVLLPGFRLALTTLGL